MAVVRKLRVDKECGTYRWLVNGQCWQLRMEPLSRRGLYRNGVNFWDAIHSVPICCVDDAVLFSKGYEYARSEPPTREDGPA